MKAIILLSGGLDSTVVLAKAIEEKRECYALSFDYGQKHRIELTAAKKIADHYRVPHQIIKIDPNAFNQSSLTSNLNVPKNRTSNEISQAGIPNTYVPARNTLFLSYALGYCESLQGQEIHFGPNQLDYSCYPDCRPDYLDAFQQLMNVATKQAVDGNPPKLVAPLLKMNKIDIVKMGILLKAPLELTWSCYSPSVLNEQCQKCDACLLRQEGFKNANSKKEQNSR